MRIETALHEGIATLVVSGEVDAAEKAVVTGTVRDLLEKGARGFVFDCENVTYMGSTGMGCLLEARKLATTRQGGVALVRPSPIIRKMIRTLGMEKEVPVFASHEEALRALAGALPTDPPPSATSPPPR